MTIGSTPDYTMGYGEEYLNFLESYDAEATTSYFHPYMESRERVLDLGCGPGFLSVWLAEAMSPTELCGIDMEPSQVELARRLALHHGCDNVEFRVADAADLPFEDASYDLVHCNDLLAFVPDTAAVLAEAKRVLKPGGVIACRDVITDSTFVYPDPGGIRRAVSAFSDLLMADDGHPEMGTSFKGHLIEAGYSEVQFSASWVTFSEQDEIELFYRLVADWYLASGIADQAKVYGATTDRQIQDLSKSIEEWRSSPGAVAGVAYGEAVAVRP